MMKVDQATAVIKNEELTSANLTLRDQVNELQDEVKDLRS